MLQFALAISHLLGETLLHVVHFASERLQIFSFYGAAARAPLQHLLYLNVERRHLLLSRRGRTGETLQSLFYARHQILSMLVLSELQSLHTPIKVFLSQVQLEQLLLSAALELLEPQQSLLDAVGVTSRLKLGMAMRRIHKGRFSGLGRETAFTLLLFSFNQTARGEVLRKAATLVKHIVDGNCGAERGLHALGGPFLDGALERN